AVALGATVAAFWVDAGSPVSHGGRAARTIEAGGLHAAWNIFSERAHLNYHQVVGIPVAGPIAFVLFFAALVALIVWAFKALDADHRTRAAVAGAAATALAALFMEDSGFLTGMILGFYPALAFAGWLCAREPRAAEQVASGEPLPESSTTRYWTR
ncbi:MAG: hypothetical protein LC663_05115, partial [Actinobacteria bacterium]|nr:hypothetical protein [Actinomycetota bacterium]